MTKSAKSQNDCFPDGAVPLESILFTEELHRRPSRPPDYKQENHALVALARVLADSPSAIFQTLAETIQDITQCDSAGLSLLTKDGKTPDACGERFYWPAIAGMWTPHIGGGTPRDFGPCGDVLDRNCTLLFKHFERRYTYFLPITPLIEECLLVPFYVGGKAVGTIWAIMHRDRRKFDAEDERLMNVLGQFASVTYQTLASMEDLKLQIAAREKAEAAVRELANGLETQVRVRTQDLERSTRDLLDTNEALEKEIAERKRAKEALQVRELNLRLLVDSIPAPVAVMTPSGEVEGVNKPVLEYFGKTFEDLKKWGTSDAVHPDDLPHAIEIWMKAIQTGQPYEVNERLRRFDGVYRWFEVRGFPLRDPNGRILNWCVLLTDIDDRQRAEEALRASERNLSLNINAMPTLLASARPDGWGDFFNQRWLEYTGLPAGQLEGWGWANPIHPDDVEGLLRMWRSSLASGTPLQAEVRMRRFDGVYRWLLFRANALHDESGAIVKWYGISADIEDRKRAEGMLAGEKRILEKVARGDSLPQILESLCRLVEEQDEDVLASVSLVHGDRLQHGGAPSLPQTFKNAIGRGVIGPCAGSCGTAAFRGEQVIVSDIAADPLWADYRDAALAHSLRACWSTPVFSSEGDVIATFAMYYREPRSPSTRDKEIIDQISHLAGVAIQRTLAEEKLRRSEAYSAEAQRLSHTGSWHWNVGTGEVAWSQEYCAIFGFDYEKDKPSYQLFIERVHPEDRSKVEQVLWADIREKRDFDGEYRLLLPDGSIKYLHSLGKCSVGQSGDAEFIGAVVDITEHKLAEQELRDSEQKHRVVVEAASDAVISVDENSTILFTNAATLRIFGYDAVELIGKPLTVLMPEFMRKLHEAGFRNYLATGQRHINWQGTELTGLRKNGQEFPVEISFGELNKHGHRIFTGFIRDISERKRAEEALRRSEAHLSQAQRLAHVGSWVWQVAGRKTVYLSEEWYRVYGFDPKLGMPTWEQRLQRVQPEDRAKWQAALDRAIDEKSDYDVEFRILPPDTAVRYIHSVGHPVFGLSGELVQFVSVSMDVTQSRQAEQAFRLLVVGTAATTGSDFFQSLVQHMAQALHARYAFVTTCDDQKHARTLAFWKGDGFGEDFDFDIADTPCKKVLHGEVCRYRQGLQGLFPLDKLLADWQAESYLGVPMLDSSNRVIGHLAILDDKPMEADSRAIDLLKIFASRAAAELKRQKAEDELQAALQERERMREELAHLAHMNRVSTMGELTASLAHEIKQPITAAVTDAQACLRWLDRDQPAVVKAREAASRLIGDAKRASDIISRVGSLFKKGIVHRELVDVNDVIQEMITLLRSEAARYSIAIDSQLSEGLPKITADRIQLQQVLMNLMINGIEAMKDLGKSGELSIKSQEDGNRQVMVSVHDNGTGLTPDQVDQIFNAFFTTKPQGTGLGLAISRSIVESHGGRLWAACDNRPGATFHFTLPIEASAHEAA